MVNHPRLQRYVGQGLCASAPSVPLVFFSALCLLINVFFSPTFADEATDLTFIRKVNPITTLKQQKVVRFNPRETSELKLTATGLIHLYQKFISNQDGPTCNFTPTCSRFGMACIQKYGVMRGIFLTADRLLRCNSSQSRHYRKDEETGRYIDPASDYATLK